MPSQGQQERIIATTAFRPRSHCLLDETVLLPGTILDTKRYRLEVGQHRLKMISKTLEELREENIEELLELVRRTRTDITSKDFLNASKLIGAVKGGLKEELDLFQNKHNPLRTLTFFAMIEWILELVREMPDHVGIRKPRIAKVEEIDRIAVVMMLGFRLSPVNQYQRPWYEKYPGDTFVDYKLQLIRSLRNPGDRVIVLEDSYRPNESGWIPPAFPENLLQEKRGNKVIVGVIIGTGFQPKEVLKDNGLYLRLPNTSRANIKSRLSRAS